MSTRQYARLVDEWVTAVGLRREDYTVALDHLGYADFDHSAVDPKGQKSVVVELRIVGEHIISGQIDVIPAQRGDLPQWTVIENLETLIADQEIAKR